MAIATNVKWELNLFFHSNKLFFEDAISCFLSLEKESEALVQRFEFWPEDFIKLEWAAYNYGGEGYARRWQLPGFEYFSDCSDVY